MLFNLKYKKCSFPLGNEYIGENKKKNNIYCIRDNCKMKRKYKTINNITYKGKSFWNKNQSTIYLNNTQKKKFLVKIKNGLLYDNKNNLLTTQKKKIFVWTPKKNIYVGLKKTNFKNNKILSLKRFQHSSFVAGKNVRFGGHIETTNGQINRIIWKSGHFKPTAGAVCQLLLFLKKRGVNINNIKISPNKKYSIPISKICYKNIGCNKNKLSKYELNKYLNNTNRRSSKKTTGKTTKKNTKIKSYKTKKKKIIKTKKKRKNKKEKRIKRKSSSRKK